jgi:dTMP kinase
MFVCLEGIDGAGKSTQSRLLCDHLNANGIPAELVCDPGTTKLGLAIRQLVLDCDDPISPVAQMLLFSTARAELSAYIGEKIASGVVIICDRWILSTLVYQCSLNNVDKDLIMRIFSATSIAPDLCLLLDISPEVAEARKVNDARKDRYERSSLAEKTAMREAYLSYAKDGACAKRVAILNADEDQANVQENIREIVSYLFSKYEG